MMFLSRVRVDLNGLSRETLFDVLNAGAYSAHQLLWRLFPEHPRERAFLFRQELESDQGAAGAIRGLPLFYILSGHEPVAVPGLLTVESKPFQPALEAGDRLAFRLRANPTVARRTSEGGRSTRSDVLMHAKHAFAPGARTSPDCGEAMDEAARSWLDERAERHGFKLVATPIVGAYRQHELQKARQRDSIRFSSVDYEGVLDVIEPGRFVAAIAQGFGRAKAFGCGLMMVRRAGTR